MTTYECISEPQSSKFLEVCKILSHPFLFLDGILMASTCNGWYLYRDADNLRSILNLIQSEVGNLEVKGSRSHVA